MNSSATPSRPLCLTTLDDFAPAKGSRLLVTGKTGSGKSFLSRRLAAFARRLIVCDAKGEFAQADPDRWSIVTSRKALRAVKRRLVLCRFAAGDYDDWDYVFRWVWEQGDQDGPGLTVLIDEINHVTPHSDPLFGLRSMVTTGRTRGISCIFNTQRPVGIPVIVRSECEAFAVFRLQTIDDRQYMSSIINDGELLRQPPRHSFWYQGGESSPALYRVGGP